MSMEVRVKRGAALAVAGVLVWPGTAMAQSAVSAGDTAWILTSTALVLFMTLPGLALFYGGLVRANSVLSVLMQCFTIACVASVLWLALGYSLAFGDGGSANAWIGGLGKAFFSGIGTGAVSGTIPEDVFFMFQMTFAIITPALIVGAYVERTKFAAVIFFSSVWLLVVYAPVTHWVWGGGWLAEMGVRDFAGGLVVHVTAGVSALVFAAMLGGRRGFPNQVRPPHNPGMTMIGAAMLWVGWFGFNAGSALAADGNAGMAMLVTHIAAATASLSWAAMEWIKFGKPSLVGIVTGMVAGLATITPASGFVGPVGALILGAAAGIVCQWVTSWLKQSVQIDDSLDVFAVHGIGGIMGTLGVSFLAAPVFQGLGLADGLGIGQQLWVQTIGVLSIATWSAVASFVIIKLADLIFGLRVSEEDEIEGLDITAHGETGYDL
ncbi:MAG: Ammonia channel [Alphaproteobacteria bacterium MarineAlpha10_Bin3]|jgi:Amt family ammonium transporter|nr:MAG: Ammonia channel [Alphaproteobacteria bacterium MarineAlpha10_Bin3]PPR71373.1 MAG: Ammonia channel [Alphaproteobacteria bacterium MarineAlpha4_Bin1]